MNILLVQLGSNGDCLFVTTIAKQIKEIDYPGCNLTWMIGSNCSHIIENNHFIDDKIIIPIKDINDLWFKRNNIKETIKKVTCGKYTILQHQKNNILCPKGVFRIFSPSSHEFPYHTDGFNYGNIIDNITKIDKTLFPMIMNSDTNSIIAIILVLQQTDNSTNEIDLHNCLVNDLELCKDEIGMYSHWMGTKYMNNPILKSKLQDKPFFSPILNTGDMYIFSASRIHKLNNLIQNKNRIVLATFGCVKNETIILYQ